VIVAVNALGKVPAWAVKPASDEPPGTVMGVDGTLNAKVSLETCIDAVLPAATGCVSVTVHDMDVCGNRYPTLQVTAETPMGATSATVALAAVAFNIAVRVATWFAERLPVETVNVIDEAFPATINDPGTLNAGDALFDSTTKAPPWGAAVDSVTVQVVLAFAPRELAPQPSAVTVTGACSDTVADAELPFIDPVSVTV
jgi:hypothetical protein